MAKTVKQWEEVWTRLIEAREKLKSFEPDHALVKHILILDDTKPGDVISLDHSLGEPSPPREVLKALENFNKALRREESVFRQLATSDMDSIALRRKFE